MPRELSRAEKLAIAAEADRELHVATGNDAEQLWAFEAAMMEEHDAEGSWSATVCRLAAARLAEPNGDRLTAEERGTVEWLRRAHQQSTLLAIIDKYLPPKGADHE